VTVSLWDEPLPLPVWAPSIGIARVADLTGLDTLGIPVVNAVVPATTDSITVYSGKGTTIRAAVTSAVMEAAERFCATLPLPVERVASWAELRRAARPALDPRTLSLPLNPAWTDTSPTAWVRGQRMSDGAPVLVPLAAAGYARTVPATNPFALVSSNGLASGPDVEAAARHALAEVVERHHWTLADLLGRVVPGLAPDRGLAEEACASFPRLDLGNAPDELRALAQRARGGGAELVVRHLAGDAEQPHVVLALLWSADLLSGCQFHHGAGCSFDLATAVSRAVCEAAQGRAVDIAAAREDLVQPDHPVAASGIHTQRAQRVPAGPWPLGGPSARPWPSDGESGDRGLDDYVVAATRLSGGTPPVLVELATPALPFRAVRVLAPGLESYIVHHSSYGPGAAARVRARVAAVLPAGRVEICR
jgi:ribosomal protein S12 methylthiotransferase accessory factor